MIIDKMTAKGNKVICSSNGQEYIMSYETAVKSKLRKNEEIDEEYFKSVMKESDKVLCKEYLLNLIERYLKTEQGYRDKLYQKGYHKEAVENALDKAKELGYIDDNNYVERYIAANINKKGSYRMMRELLAKGVKKDTICARLDTLDNQSEVIFALASKFMKNKDLTLANKQKLFRSLAQKGFDTDSIMKAVNEIFQGEEQD